MENNGATNQKAQVFLALVFFIGGIVAIIGLLIAFYAASSADTGYGVASSFSAESVATAGVEDALLRLDRNPAFPSGSSVTSTYTVTSGSATATVTVTNPSTTGQATILSVATVAGHTKKIQVVIAENPDTGQSTIISWTEIQ